MVPTGSVRTLGSEGPGSGWSVRGTTDSPKGPVPDVTGRGPRECGRAGVRLRVRDGKVHKYHTDERLNEESQFYSQTNKEVKEVT